MSDLYLCVCVQAGRGVGHRQRGGGAAGDQQLAGGHGGHSGQHKAATPAASAGKEQQHVLQAYRISRTTFTVIPWAAVINDYGYNEGHCPLQKKKNQMIKNIDSYVLIKSLIVWIFFQKVKNNMLPVPNIAYSSSYMIVGSVYFCGSGMIFSGAGSSFEFSEFRIRIQPKLRYRYRI